MTQMNLSMKQKQSHRHIENRLVVAKREGVGGGIDWEVGISRCKLLYVECINNKVLLYSTENYIQYPMRPSNPTSGHIPRENYNSKRHMHSNVHCSTIYNSQVIEAT